MASQIELIKELRERTGAGLMDCKKALLENGNDIEKAIDYLREKGIAKNAKKADRIAAEGLTGLKIEGNKAAIVEVNCETDFVSSNDIFKELVKQITDIVFASEPADNEAALASKNAEGKSVNDLLQEAGIRIREKLAFRRFLIVKKNDDEIFGSYVHMGGQITSLVILKGGDATLADNIAMCVVSDNPTYASLSDVDPKDIEHETEVEKEVAKNDPSFAKKPEAIQKKILEGRISKHFQTQVFTYQEYVLDSSKTVGQVLKENKAELVKFYKIHVGEGIEKRVDDFAAEVAAQAAQGK
jgi:elongation factor Ts